MRPAEIADAPGHVEYSTHSEIHTGLLSLKATWGFNCRTSGTRTIDASGMPCLADASLFLPEADLYRNNRRGVVAVLTCAQIVVELRVGRRELAAERWSMRVS